MSKIVVFGATGYTGRMAARSLVARNAAPVVVAGRDELPLSSLAEELGEVEVAHASVGDDGLLRLLDDGDVLITTVGPFSTLGTTAVEAAIARRATYVDCAGEGPFHRAIFEEWDERARAAGVALLTGLGADWVPGNVVGATALQAAGADRTAALEIEYLVTGASFEFSAGSLRTGAALAGQPSVPYAFRDGEVVDTASHSRQIDGPDGPVTAHRASSTEPWTLSRLEPSLTSIDVHLAMPAAKKPQGLGPSEESRALNHQVVSAHAYDAEGHALAGARIRAANGYDYTGDVLAWAAHTAVTDGVNGVGALGPVEAFGLEALGAFHDAVGADVTTWSSAEDETALGTMSSRTPGDHGRPTPSSAQPD